MAAQMVERDAQCSHQKQIQDTKTLICALNLLSRNLPLPPYLFHAVSSIYHHDADDSAAISGGSDDGAGGSDTKSIHNDTVPVNFSFYFLNFLFIYVCVYRYMCFSIGRFWKLRLC